MWQKTVTHLLFKSTCLFMVSPDTTKFSHFVTVFPVKCCIRTQRILLRKVQIWSVLQRFCEQHVDLHSEEGLQLNIWDKNASQKWKTARGTTDVVQSLRLGAGHARLQEDSAPRTHVQVRILFFSFASLRSLIWYTMLNRLFLLSAVLARKACESTTLSRPPLLNSMYEGCTKIDRSSQITRRRISRSDFFLLRGEVRLQVFHFKRVPIMSDIPVHRGKSLKMTISVKSSISPLCSTSLRQSWKFSKRKKHAELSGTTFCDQVYGRTEQESDPMLARSSSCLWWACLGQDTGVTLAQNVQVGWSDNLYCWQEAHREEALSQDPGQHRLDPRSSGRWQAQNNPWTGGGIWFVSRICAQNCAEGALVLQDMRQICPKTAHRQPKETQSRSCCGQLGSFGNEWSSFHGEDCHRGRDMAVLLRSRNKAALLTVAPKGLWETSEASAWKDGKQEGHAHIVLRFWRTHPHSLPGARLHCQLWVLHGPWETEREHLPQETRNVAEELWRIQEFPCASG